MVRWSVVSGESEIAIRGPAAQMSMEKWLSLARVARDHPPPTTDHSPSHHSLLHVRQRIDRLGALAQLEVQLRLIDGAGLAGLGDHLAAADHVVALDQD